MSFWELCQMLFGAWLAFVVLGIPAAILKSFWNPCVENRESNNIMTIVEQSVTSLQNSNALERIEYAGRVCYNSTDKIKKGESALPLCGVWYPQAMALLWRLPGCS